MNEQHLQSHEPRRSPALTRRTLLRAAAGGAGTLAAAMLFAACGGSESPTATSGSSGQTTGLQPTAGGTSPTRAASSPGTAPTPGGNIAASSAASAVTTSGGQVSLLWPKPVTLQPLFSTAGTEQQVERLLFGALVKMNDRLDPIPDLAEKVEASPDAKTYTFSLKKTLKFTDGQPLTAKDVVFTIERAVDKRTGSYWRGRLLGLAGATEYGDQKADRISGLETPDDYTIKMTFTAPDASWLVVLGNFSGLGILPAHVLENIAPDQLQKFSFSLAPTVSAGPFQFVQFLTDQHLELKRNETYGGGPKARLDRLFFKILDPNTGIAELERGELDLMTAPVSEVDRLKKNANLTVASVSGASIARLIPNLDRPLFKDKRVRQAMMYAIDRAGIVKEIYKGEAQIINSPIIGPDWMGTPAGLSDYAYDPDKARKLLTEANWDSGQKIEAILAPSGKEQDAYAPVIQQQLKDVGISLTLRSLDTSEFVRLLDRTSDFAIAFNDGGVFRADPNISANFFESVNFTPSGGNFAHYANSRVDELFKAGRGTTDTAQRKQVYTQLAQVLNDEVPWVFLWSANSLFAYNKRLQGFKPPSYFNNQVWNAEEWTVTK